MRRSRRGAAAVEFAMCLPFTVLLAAGIIDIGQAISFRHTLQRAARDAARVGAAITVTVNSEPADEDDVEAAAVSHGIAALEAVLPGCDTACTTEANWYTGDDGNEYLEVLVRAPLAPIFGIVPGLEAVVGNRFTVMTRLQE